MEQSPGQPAEGAHQSKFARIALVTLLLAAVVVCELFAGWTTSFILFYAAVVAVTTWLLGLGMGQFVCALAVLARIGVNLLGAMPTANVFWNGGMMFGMLLTISVLVDQLKAHRPGFSLWKTLGLTFGVGIGVAVALGVVGVVAEKALPNTRLEWQASVNSAFGQAKETRHSNPLEKLVVQEQACMRMSRSVFLGSRNPDERSCIKVISKGDVTDVFPPTIGDLDGGPGTLLSVLLTFDRQNVASASGDYRWQQGRLRTFLENKLSSNYVARAPAEALLAETTRLADRLASATALPAELQAIEFDRDDEWLAYCILHLNEAIRAHNLSQARRWSQELQVASFALVDLHRWLDFLLGNFLTALDFQKDLESVFVKADTALPGYQYQTHMSALPAGLAVLHGIDNFMEVERQAERIYTMPLERLDELSSDKHLTAESIWVSPSLRDGFIKLSGSLSPDNRKILADAARQPFNHSYLINMLFRATESRTIDELAEVLRRFDKTNPQATTSQLMGALMYRGHSFAGIEWSDRYLPELMEAATTINGTDEDALIETCEWTNKFYREQAEYGPTFTLRDSLEHGRLDCNRATDMMAALFRNSGHARFGHVRICSESFAHSVAAYLTFERDKPKALLADGLNPPEKPELFPDAYFHGHAWPPTMENNPPPSSVELYVRGLDNYVWAEGYIIRGPHAGELRKAAIPYLMHRDQTGKKKVFEGPYPD